VCQFALVAPKPIFKQYFDTKQSAYLTLCRPPNKLAAARELPGNAWHSSLPDRHLRPARVDTNLWA